MADKKETQTTKKTSDKFTSKPGEFTIVTEEAFRRAVKKPRPSAQAKNK